MKPKSLLPSIVLAITLLAPSAAAQLATQDLTTGLTAQDLIDALVGTGPDAPIISNITINCHDQAAGVFTGGLASGLDFDNGIILSSGCIDNVIAAGGLNNSPAITCNFGLPGDPDLDALIPGFTTFDACILEFDFECEDVQILSFQYVFASEEYNEWVGSAFNDVFGFFVNGVNIALLPDGVTTVSINNVNNNTNSAFYIDNECGSPVSGLGTYPCLPHVETEMDGLTITLTATTTIPPGTNHIKLAIADAGDHVLDSVVFIKGESFICGVIGEGGEGCSQGFWKQPHHLHHWVFYDPADLFCDVFNCSTAASMDAYGGKTLLDVLWQGGGQLKALGRQAVAALLNATSSVNYDLSAGLVIQMVNDAIASGSNQQINAVKDELDKLNNQGCPSFNSADLTGPHGYPDGMVDTLDLVRLISDWGKPGPADLNDDGTVDIFDMIILINNWGPVNPQWTPTDDSAAAQLEDTPKSSRKPSPGLKP